GRAPRRPTESLRPHRKASRSATLHIQVPEPPRRPAGAMRPSRAAFRSAPVVLKPQYFAASLVGRSGGQRSAPVRGSASGGGNASRACWLPPAQTGGRAATRTGGRECIGVSQKEAPGA